jgi:hypothetical protein
MTHLRIAELEKANKQLSEANEQLQQHLQQLQLQLLNAATATTDDANATLVYVGDGLWLNPQSVRMIWEENRSIVPARSASIDGIFVSQEVAMEVVSLLNGKPAATAAQ